jgi:hypothetical protein
MGLGRARGAALAGLALLTALATGLGGCNPIETYRSWTGISQNDPNPKTAPFTHNMAMAYKEPYPNLASVPPLPTTETSTAEREKLTRSLVADRGALTAGGQPPSVAAEPAMPAATAFRAPPPLPADLAAAAAAPPAAGPASHIVTAKAEPASRRQPGAPPHVPPPQDSTLHSPEIPGPLPQPEAAQPAPPAPGLRASPPPAAPPLSGAAVASATPAPPPPVPVLAPIAAPKVKDAATAAPAAITVATLDIAPRPGPPDRIERAAIARAAALYRKQRGVLRVVAFAAAPPPGGDPLASYHAALDRAQAVATALAKAGVPSRKIQIEATPAAGSRVRGRVVIRLAPP